MLVGWWAAPQRKGRDERGATNGDPCWPVLHGTRCDHRLGWLGPELGEQRAGQERTDPVRRRRHAHASPCGGLQPQARRSLRSEEHTSELQSLRHLVCRLLLEKKKKQLK